MKIIKVPFPPIRDIFRGFYSGPWYKKTVAWICTFLLAVLLFLMAVDCNLFFLFGSTPEDPRPKINEVLAIYSQLGIRADVEARIAKLHESAMRHLDAVSRPDNAKEPLRKLACSLLDRNV